MNGQLYQIPVMDTISEAWSKVSGSKASFWAAIGVILFLMFCFGFIAGIIGTFSKFLTPLLNMIINIVAFLLQMGVLYIGIKRAYDQPISFRLMFRSLDKDIALRLLGVYILEFLIFLPIMAIFVVVIVSVLAFAIPKVLAFTILVPIFVFIMLYIIVRLSLAYAFVLDQGTGPIQAISYSFRVTRHNFWNLAGIILLQFCFMILGVIPLGIGLIWVFPFSYICFGLIYKKLLANLVVGK